MRILFTFVLLFSFAMVNGQIVRTIHQTVQKEQAHLLQFDFDAEIEIEEWTGSRILVQTTISLEGANKNIIEHLIEAGRYDLVQNNQAGVIRLDFHNHEKKIVVRNNELNEVITLKVFVPAGVHVAESLASK